MYLNRKLLRQAGDSRFPLILTIGLGFAGGVLIVAQALLLSRIIDRVFLGGGSLAAVRPWMVTLLVVILLRGVTLCGGEVAAKAIATRVKVNLRERLYQHIIALGPSYLSGERTGELTNVAVEGIESLDAYFSQYLPQLVLAALIPLTYLAFVFPLDTLSGVVLLVTAPLIPVFMALIGNLARAMTQKQWGALSRMTAHFLDVLQGLTPLKILGRSRAQIEVIARVSERYRDATMRVLRVAFLSSLVLEMVATISTAVVAVEIGLRLLYGRLEFEGALFVLLLTPEFYLPLRSLGARFHAGVAGVSAAERIFQILDQQPLAQGALPHIQKDSSDEYQLRESLRNTHYAIRPPQSAIRDPQSPIHFQSVYFSYADQRPALNAVDLDIQAGEVVALVGPSGAGKSTLAQLLLRFIEPQQGQIYLGEEPLECIPPDAWRKRIAWVPQIPYLFNDTVLANIRLARPDASMEEVVRAARGAQAHEFIQDLPQGYNTVIGERGARLSGGQAQRIALTRAFLKDAPVLILDEPSAHLDPDLQASFQAAMAELIEDRTAIIIAHRLNTVYQADWIVVMDNGEIVQTGTHSELVVQDGLYRQLVSTGAGQSVRKESNILDDQPINEQRDEEAYKPPDISPMEQAIGPTPSRAAAAILFRLTRLISPFTAWIALSVALGTLTIGSSIGLLAASAYIISAAALHPSIAELQVAIVGVRFFGISRGVFRYLERYVSHQVTFRLLAQLRVWFYTALEPLAPARLMVYRSGDLLRRIVADIESLENFYLRALAPPLVALLVAVLGCGLLYRYAPVLALVLLLFFALGGIAVPILVGWLSRGLGARQVEIAASLNSLLVDGIQGLADLLAFGRGEAQLMGVRRLSSELARVQQRLAWVTGFQTALVSTLTHLCIWVILVTAVPLVASGALDGVYLAGLVLIAFASFEAISPLPQAVEFLDGSLEAARRLFNIVDAQPQVQDPEPHLASPTDTSLTVRNLHFSYPVFNASSPANRASYHTLTQYALRNTASPFTLADISFDLPHGKRLAVVGPSGGGKTTLINLLLRFWAYQEGSIWLGGGELRDYDQEDVRRMFGVVSQHTHLFNASVRENLLLARPTATGAEILEAAKTAQIHDFIQSLPDGYETWIGEQGLRLSGGERQRLAIARALLKDAPILLLDEPTANLDAITEAAVMEAIWALMADRSTLLITHRLVGMDWMDEILVLREGRIIERGTHQDLLIAGGLYARMWHNQNQVLVEL